MNRNGRILCLLEVRFDDIAGTKWLSHSLSSDLKSGNFSRVELNFKGEIDSRGDVDDVSRNEAEDTSSEDRIMNAREDKKTFDESPRQNMHPESLYEGVTVQEENSGGYLRDSTQDNCTDAGRSITGVPSGPLATLSDSLLNRRRSRYEESANHTDVCAGYSPFGDFNYRQRNELIEDANMFKYRIEHSDHFFDKEYSITTTVSYTDQMFRKFPKYMRMSHSMGKDSKPLFWKTFDTDGDFLGISPLLRSKVQLSRTCSVNVVYTDKNLYACQSRDKKTQSTVSNDGQNQDTGESHYHSPVGRSDYQTGNVGTDRSTKENRTYDEANENSRSDASGTSGMTRYERVLQKTTSFNSIQRISALQKSSDRHSPTNVERITIPADIRRMRPDRLSRSRSPRRLNAFERCERRSIQGDGTLLCDADCLLRINFFAERLTEQIAELAVIDLTLKFKLESNPRALYFSELDGDDVALPPMTPSESGEERTDDGGASFSVVADDQDVSPKPLGWFSIFGGMSRRLSRDDRPRSALPFVLSVSRRPSSESSRKSSAEFMDLLRRASGTSSTPHSDNDFKLPDHAFVGLSGEEKEHVVRVMAASRKTASSQSTPSASRRDSISLHLPDLEDLHLYERQHIQDVIEKAEKRAPPFVIKVTNAIDTIKESSVDSVDVPVTGTSLKIDLPATADASEVGNVMKSVSEEIDDNGIRVDPVSCENPSDSSIMETSSDHPSRSVSKDFKTCSKERELEKISSQIEHKSLENEGVHPETEIDRKQQETSISSLLSEGAYNIDYSQLTPLYEMEDSGAHEEKSEKTSATAMYNDQEMTAEELEHIQRMAEIAASMDAELTFPATPRGPIMKRESVSHLPEKQHELRSSELSIEKEEHSGKMPQLAMDLDAELPLSIETIPNYPASEGPTHDVGSAFTEDSLQLLSSVHSEEKPVRSLDETDIATDDNSSVMFTAEELEHFKRMAECAANMDQEAPLPSEPYGRVHKSDITLPLMGDVQQPRNENVLSSVENVTNVDIIKRDSLNGENSGENIQEGGTQLTAEELAHIAYVNSLAEAESEYSQPIREMPRSPISAHDEQQLSADELEHIRAIERMAQAEENPSGAFPYEIAHDPAQQVQQPSAKDKYESSTTMNVDHTMRIPSAEAISGKVSSLSRVGFGKLKGAMNVVAKAAAETLPIVDDQDDDDVYYVADEIDEKWSDRLEETPFDDHHQPFDASHRQRMLEAGLTDHEIDQIAEIEAKAMRELPGEQTERNSESSTSEEILVQEIGTDNGITEEEMEHIRKIEEMANTMETAEMNAQPKSTSIFSSISSVSKTIGLPQLNLADLKESVSKPLSGVRQFGESLKTDIQEEREENKKNKSFSVVSVQLTDEELEHIARIQRMAEAEEEAVSQMKSTSSVQRKSDSTLPTTTSVAQHNSISHDDTYGEGVEQSTVIKLSPESIDAEQADPASQPYQSGLLDEVESEEHNAESASSEETSGPSEATSDEDVEYGVGIDQQMRQSSQEERLDEIEVKQPKDTDQAMQITATGEQLTAEELEHIRRVQEMADAIDVNVTEKPSVRPFGMDIAQQISQKTSSFAGFGFGKIKNAMNQAVQKGSKDVSFSGQREDMAEPVRQSTTDQTSKHKEGLTDDELKHIQEVARRAEMDTILRNAADPPHTLQAESQSAPVVEQVGMITDLSSTTFVQNDRLPSIAFAEAKTAMNAVGESNQLTAEEMEHIKRINEMAQINEQLSTGIIELSSQTQEIQQQEAVVKANVEELSAEELEHIQRIAELAENDLLTTAVADAADVQSKGADEKPEVPLTDEELAHIRKIAELAEQDGIVQPNWEHQYDDERVPPAYESPNEYQDVTDDSSEEHSAYSVSNSSGTVCSLATPKEATDIHSDTAEEQRKDSFDLNEREDIISRYADADSSTDAHEQADLYAVTDAIAASREQGLEDDDMQKSEKHLPGEGEPLFVAGAAEGREHSSEDQPEKCEHVDRSRSHAPRTISLDTGSIAFDRKLDEQRSAVTVVRSESLDADRNKTDRLKSLRRTGSRIGEFRIKSVKELSLAEDVSEWYEEQLNSLRNSICDDESLKETGLFFVCWIILLFDEFTAQYVCSSARNPQVRGKNNVLL
ncbi:unnamed protein product [Anisakis simplex]|uniref:SH2 domain-containing protein n=1 Tax=Anisakis simplex TaxID=6269 RepID=A0A0M3JYE8_ANISI|nr:unnamed protein product [Anisakis simplex]